MKQKPHVGSTFFRAFPSDCIHKATEDVNVYLFIHSIPHTVNYTSKFKELFEAGMYITDSTSH